MYKKQDKAPSEQHDVELEHEKPSECSDVSTFTLCERCGCSGFLVGGTLWDKDSERVCWCDACKNRACRAFIPITDNYSLNRACVIKVGDDSWVRIIEAKKYNGELGRVIESLGVKARVLLVKSQEIIRIPHSCLSRVSENVQTFSTVKSDTIQFVDYFKTLSKLFENEEGQMLAAIISSFLQFELMTAHFNIEQKYDEDMYRCVWSTGFTSQIWIGEYVDCIYLQEARERCVQMQQRDEFRGTIDIELAIEIKENTLFLEIKRTKVPRYGSYDYSDWSVIQVFDHGDLIECVYTRAHRAPWTENISRSDFFCNISGMQVADVGPFVESIFYPDDSDDLD